jgi:hypothetical protein
MSQLSFDPKTTTPNATITTNQIREIVDTLFGHSDVLDQHLVPALQSSLADRAKPIPDYESFIDLCAAKVRSWDYEKKGHFLSGHPEIGAPKVTGLSAKEQGTAQVDPQTLRK